MNGRSCSSSAVSDRGMESDSVFHNFLVCMELLLVLQAFLAIPNLNALPVHYAKQVYLSCLACLLCCRRSKWGQDEHGTKVPLRTTCALCMRRSQRLLGSHSILP